MRIYVLAVSMTVIHLAAGGFGSVVITNLVSQTGVATYGGPSGFVPGEESPYSAFGTFLYGDDSPDPALPGEDSGGLGLARYGMTEGICVISGMVKWGIIITTFAYPVIDIIPMEGFGLWVRIGIHLLSLAAFVAFFFRLVEMLAGWGVFSNVYVMVAIGLISSVGLLATILTEATNVAC